MAHHLTSTPVLHFLMAAWPEALLISLPVSSEGKHLSEMKKDVSRFPPCILWWLFVFLRLCPSSLSRQSMREPAPSQFRT